MGCCAWCGKDRELRKSHILPDAFSSHIRETMDGSLVLVSSDRPGRRKAPGGIYDKGLLCDDCEQRLGIFDNAAVTAFKARYDEWKKVAIVHSTPKEWILSCDPEQIKRFSLSFLVRAHYSQQDAFRKVDLGGQIDAIKRYCDSSNADAERYPFALLRFSRSKLHANAEMVFAAPERDRWNGKIAYRYNLAGFGFLQVTDGQKNQELGALQEALGSYLVAFHKEFDTPELIGNLRRLVQSAVRKSLEL
jgi:hypothetical protein